MYRNNSTVLVAVTSVARARARSGLILSARRRRQVVSRSIISTLLLWAALARANDWPQYQGAPGKEGRNDTEHVSQLEPRGGLVVDTTDFGRLEETATVFSTAGVAIVGDTGYVEGNQGSLKAFD